MKTLFFKILLLAVLVLPATAQTALQLEITDGKDNRSVLKAQAQKSAAADGISVTQTYAPAQKNRPETWNFTIKNNGDSERWLYLNWETV